MNLKDGSMQARYKAISRLFIRVEKTLGGRVGEGEDFPLDEPKYRSDEAYGCHTRLKTGDIELSFPGGFKMCIRDSACGACRRRRTGRLRAVPIFTGKSARRAESGNSKRFQGMVRAVQNLLANPLA